MFIKDLISSVNLNRIARSQNPAQQDSINKRTQQHILSHGGGIFTTQMKQNHSHCQYHFWQSKLKILLIQCTKIIPFGLSSAATKGKNLIKSDWAFQKSILD